MTIPNSTAITRFRSREEEKRIVSRLTTTSSNERVTSYFIISKTWYRKWQRYVDQPLGRAAPRPGPINNHDIIDTRRPLVEDEDYLLVPEQVWNILHVWYNGGPPIPMAMIYLFLSDDRDNDVTDILLPKQASMKELYEKVCAKKKISQEKVRIWDYLNMNKGKLLDPSSNKSIEESGLHMEQDILLDVDGSLEVNEQAMEEPSGSGKLGLAGLVNLGNTCYMNTALQCLAHTPPILEYFLRDDTKDGPFAKAFGKLLKELWSSGSNVVVEPRLFKTKLDKVAPQFSGYGQHDSHELLISLLAALHEVSDGVNFCQGQCNSTLVCPVCWKTATTYDSFTCLTLPLPLTPNRSITVTVFSCDGSHLPMSYTVTVPRSGSCSDLVAALRSACCLTHDESLLLAMVYENKIFRYFEDPLESLSVMIKDGDHVVACRMNQMQKESGKAKLELLHGGQGRRTSFSGEKTRQEEEEVISLFSCLEEYLAEEPLGPDNMWECPECKKMRQANKKLDLWKLPDILMFQLKRFKGSNYFTKKIDTFVDYPIKDLDLSKYVGDGESYLYELYAVSNHHGGIDAVGHYTAYAKLIDDDDNKWYRFNDSLVSPVNESEIKSKAAYVLFYRRVGSESAEVSSTDDMDLS